MKVQQYDPKKYQPITRPDIVIEYQTTYDTIQYVCPIIDKEWNQSEPFNVSLEGTQFEGCPMGCGPLAIALICTNFRRPYQYDGYIYNWELIDQMNNAYDLMSNSMGAYAVSKLIKDVGTMSSVEYYPTGSPINSEGLENALDECGFKFNEPTTFEAGYNNTVYSLQLRQAVIMTGNTSAGHAWVLDGLMKITEDVKAYDQDGNPIPNTILEEHNYQTERDYVHCNMGWGGILNGYKYSAYEKNAELAPTLTYIYSNIFKNINNETYSNLTVYNGITPKI